MDMTKEGGEDIGLTDVVRLSVVTASTVAHHCGSNLLYVLSRTALTHTLVQHAALAAISRSSPGAH